MENSCINMIEKRFNAKNPQTFIVDVHTTEEMNEIIEHFSVGNTIIISASDYCKNDELPRLDNLYDVIARKNGNVIVTELTSFLRLVGEKELKTQLSNILGLQTIGRVVFLSFCCADMLAFTDPRIKPRIYTSKLEMKRFPDIVLVNKELSLPDGIISCEGIHNLGSIVETENVDKLYIVSGKRKSIYQYSLYSVNDLSSSYDILCQRDSSTYRYNSDLGTEEQWSYALSLFTSASCWEEVVSSEFGNYKSLEYAIPKYESFESNKKWLFFIALKMFGVSNNEYLKMVISSSETHDDFIHQIYRLLLSIDNNDSRFSGLYSERKSILKYFDNRADEAMDYCKMSKSKLENGIFYLTDLTSIEKECIFEYLDKFGLTYKLDKLTDILSVVYPDLKDYLSAFRFKNQLLDDYFQQYKHQKVINKVLPEFIEVVEEQAEKREFTLILEPRTAKFDKIDKNNSQLYFMDAMGVEYLGYILAKCHQKGLEARVSVCYSELPSLTCFNKEFVSIYEELNLPVISVKEIDEIKHHGKYDYNYLQTKLPIHLIKELSIIDTTLDRIRSKLSREECNKIIMIADHGSSRLAVINNKENKWEMSTKGIHSGRCCPKSDIDSQPDCSTEERDYWVLANYDRFKGGRKANVEVHGGATLEEIVVPIIEITLKTINIEIKIMEPVITVSFRKKAEITLFSKTTIHDVTVCVNGKYYDAQSVDNNFFKVEMPDLKKKGEYFADVYSAGNLLVSGLQFTVEKEGTKENKLF